MDTLMCLTMLFWKTLVRVNHFKMKKISNVHTLLFQTINTLEIWNRHLMNSLELLMTQNRPFCFSRLLIMIFFAVYIPLTKNYFYKYISQFRYVIAGSETYLVETHFSGKFDLEGVDQNDWEDITMLEYNGIDYIYVSDTGNNWDGHCRGTDNYEDMRVYRFPEPDLSRFRYGLK